MGGKKAVGVEAWPFALAEPGYIIFWAELNKGQKLTDARQALLATLEGFKSKPVTEAELKRAKASLLNDIDKTLNDPQQLAVEMSEAIAKGDWRLFFLNRDRIEALSARTWNGRPRTTSRRPTAPMASSCPPPSRNAA